DTVSLIIVLFFFVQAEDGIRYRNVTGVQTCALPIFFSSPSSSFFSSAFAAMQAEKAAKAEEKNEEDGDEKTPAASRVNVQFDKRSEERRVGQAGGEESGRGK